MAKARLNDHVGLKFRVVDYGSFNCIFSNYTAISFDFYFAIASNALNFELTRNLAALLAPYILEQKPSNRLRNHTRHKKNYKGI